MHPTTMTEHDTHHHQRRDLFSIFFLRVFFSSIFCVGKKDDKFCSAGVVVCCGFAFVSLSLSDIVLVRYPRFTISTSTNNNNSGLQSSHNTMLSGSIETVSTSYEDSGVLLEQQQQQEGSAVDDFGFIGEEDPDADFEKISKHTTSTCSYQHKQESHPRTISRNGSFDLSGHQLRAMEKKNNENEEDEDEEDDELASTGILIIGPSIETRPMAEHHHNNPSLSPRLSLPGTESLPTDMQSLHLGSIHTPSINSSTSSLDDNEVTILHRHHRHSHDHENSYNNDNGDAIINNSSGATSNTRQHQQVVYWVYGILSILVLVLCMSLFSTIFLLAERHSWVQSNQNLQDQMKRMQSDWVHLATQWQRDQEASLATSRTIKATLQAQVEEQRRKIEEIYQEQRKEQEKRERLERQQEEARRQRKKEQERRKKLQMNLPPLGKTKNINEKKKNKSFESSKSFDDYWTDTEEAILKWSDETHYKLRTIMDSLGKKMWKAKENFIQQADRAFQQADRAFQQARTRIVKAWSDFYAAVHEPKEGLMEKAAPVVSTFLLATAAAALTEGTSRFVRYYMQEDED